MAAAVLFLLLRIFMFLIHLNSAAAQNCGTAYQPCSPPGAINSLIPSLTSGGLGNFYIDLLDTVNPQTPPKVVSQSTNGPARRMGSESSRDEVTAAVCCLSTMACMLLTNLQVPMCYDKWTTDFFFPDGSYGTVSNGSYTTSSNDTANLISGIYTMANGRVGALGQSLDTSTLSNIPTQYTSSGVGAAIGASTLGSEATYTTTVPGSYIPLTTVPPQTVSPLSGYGSIIVNVTTLPGYTSGGNTAPPTIVSVTTTRASITPGVSRVGKMHMPALLMMVMGTLVILGLWV